MSQKKNIHVQIKCFATLRKHAPTGGYLSLKAGNTVRDIASRLDLDIEEVKIIFVNNKQANWDRELRDGDQVGLFPAVGGG